MAKGGKRVRRAPSAATTKTRASPARASGTKKGAGIRATKKSTGRSAATRVMRVTIPKRLTNVLDGLVNSPRGREILASALVAAAGAAAAALVKSPDSSQPAKARIAAAEVGDQVAEVTKDLGEVAAEALADIVTGAARSLLPKSPAGSTKRDE